MKVIDKKSVNTNVKRTTKGKTETLTTYQDQVLRVNKAMKEEFGSLNGAIRFILLYAKESKLDARRKKILNAILKNQDMYKVFAENVRRTKKGKFPAFYVLQYLNRSIVDADKAAAKAVKEANKK